MPTLPELALILVIVLVLFAANRLPRAGDALGRAVSRRLAALRGKGRRQPPGDRRG